MHYTAMAPVDVCTMQIDFDINEDGALHNVVFTGGCPGNLAAIGKLVEGKKADDIADLQIGNTCGPKDTSCTDVLAKAITKALEDR